MKCLVASLLLVVICDVMSAPIYTKVPIKDMARKPLAAKQPDSEDTAKLQIPVTYEPRVNANAGLAAKNGMHQRAADNRVIIHHDAAGYNSTGTYAGGSKTGGANCCKICPKDPKCKMGSCYSTCVTVCGAQCGIPMGSTECTIGANCGFKTTTSDTFGATHDQDMVKGYLSKKAGAKAGINPKATPKAQWARKPLPAKEPAEQAPAKAKTLPTEQLAGLTADEAAATPLLTMENSLKKLAARNDDMEGIENDLSTDDDTADDDMADDDTAASSPEHRPLPIADASPQSANVDDAVTEEEEGATADDDTADAVLSATHPQSAQGEREGEGGREERSANVDDDVTGGWYGPEGGEEEEGVTAVDAATEQAKMIADAAKLAKENTAAKSGGYVKKFLR